MRHNGVLVPAMTANAGTFIGPDGKTYRRKPHPWTERRDQVIQTFQNRIKALVEPFGYVAPLTEMPGVERLKEIEWIRDTCEQELAPEWLRLSANGISAMSLDSSIENDDGESYSMSEGIEDDPYLMEWSAKIEENRIEPFLRLEDERQWYSELPKRYFWAYDTSGNIGLITGNARTTMQDCQNAINAIARAGRMPTLEQVKEWCAARGKPKQPKPVMAVWRDEMELWFDRLDPEREAFRIADEQARYDAQPEQREYAPSSPCPEIARGKCRDGKALVEVTTSFKNGRTVFTQHYDDCWACSGSGVVPHTLGLHEDGELISTLLS